MEIKLKGEKSETVKQIIFDLLDIFKLVGIPLKGLSDRSLEKMAIACMAVGQIKHSLSEAQSVSSGIFYKTRDIIKFENANYSENISSGSYDDIRRKDLKLLVEASLIVRSSSVTNKATNNPSQGYALNDDFSELLHKYHENNWEICLQHFNSHHQQLSDELAKRREMSKVPVTLPNGQKLDLSYGEHNQLQKAIIEEFLPRFGFSRMEVLYIGDTSNKFLYKEDKLLSELNFFTLEHDELPDIVAYNKDKNLLYLIEAVHSSGPMDELRVKNLKKLLKKCPCNILFFTAFQKRDTFKKWASQIAWETEVWIAENPDHLIHFNGYKFLELHK